MTFFTIHNPIRWTFLFHTICGALALATFLIPLFSKKGGKTHIKTGWAYTYAMLAVSVSTFIISPWRILFDEKRTIESQGFSAFLFFIAVFTLSTLYFGIVSLKFKDRTAPSKAFIHIGPPLLLIALSLAIQIVGIKTGNMILVGFPFLALSTAKSQLSYWLRTPDSKRHWWYAHMSGMGTACIATLTAFLVTALPRLWISPIANSPILWFAPGILGGFLLNKWTAKYKQQFGDAVTQLKNES